MSDWQDDQLSNKRFPHKSQATRKSRGRRHGNDRHIAFQTRNMLGRYTVGSDRMDKMATEGAGPVQSWLEIHELVASGTAYLASFSFGIVSGVMLIAGSRKSLRNAVEEEEEEDDAEEEETRADAKAEADNTDGAALDWIEESVHKHLESDGEVEHSDTERNDDTEEQDSGGELRDRDLAQDSSFLTMESLDQCSHAFEKNTFKEPKWFAQWHGTCLQGHARPESKPAAEPGELHIRSEGHVGDKNDGDGQKDQCIDGMAHFTFSSSACHDFKATFSCSALSLKDVAMQGWRITDKATPAVRSWSDVT